MKYDGARCLFRHFCVSQVISTAYVHKSSVIFHIFPGAFKQKHIKELETNEYQNEYQKSLKGGGGPASACRSVLSSLYTMMQYVCSHIHELKMTLKMTFDARACQFLHDYARIADNTYDKLMSNNAWKMSIALGQEKPGFQLCLWHNQACGLLVWEMRMLCWCCGWLTYSRWRSIDNWVS